MPGVLAEIQELFGDKSLYDILSISKEARKNEIRKAYLQLSLKVHPDRAPADQLAKATKEFQALGKIYEVLSDDGKRALYDEEGSVDDECAAFSDDRDWNEYWRLLFPRVNLDDISKFSKQYKGSKEEVDDLKQAYIDSEGDMDHIIDSVLCATIDDEPRFRKILADLIAKGTVAAYSAFTHEKRSKQTARKRKAEAEAKEAERMRKKLAKTEEQSLSSLIQRNQKSRGEQADAFFSYMEKKYGAGGSHEEEDSPSPTRRRGTGAGGEKPAAKRDKSKLPTKKGQKQTKSKSSESESPAKKSQKKPATASPAKGCRTVSKPKLPVVKKSARKSKS